MDVTRVLGLQLGGVSDAALVPRLERLGVRPRLKSGLELLASRLAQLVDAANPFVPVIIKYDISGILERLLPLFAI